MTSSNFFFGVKDEADIGTTLAKLACDLQENCEAALHIRAAAPVEQIILEARHRIAGGRDRIEMTAEQDPLRASAAHSTDDIVGDARHLDGAKVSELGFDQVG